MVSFCYNIRNDFEKGYSMKHIVETFLNIVNERGNDLAVSDDFGTFTYAELYAYSKCIAANLRAKGVGHASRVIVEIPRSKEYAGCLIGCWLIGAVTIPLSDDYPEERLAYIKKDSKYELSIDDEFIKSLDMTLETEPSPFNMDDEGLVIYTSGSTGNPKGVIHDYSSMAAAVNRNIVHDDENKNDRNCIVGLIAPFTFIVGVSHFLTSISTGRHLVIVPDEIRRDPFKLAKYYEDNDVQQSYVPPRMVDFMLEHNKSLKVISVGSERITNLYYNDNPVVFNGYGATEIFGGTLSFKIDKNYDNTPIGKPVGEEKAYVVDDNFNEVEIGELCISGHVAKGYLNREEETKKAFIKNPFKDIDGFDRMFRTGDIVQRLPDGNLVFIERKDWMIKINGQRVEPLEVEGTIRRIPGIREVAIKDFTNKNGVTFLAAYYVCDDALTEDEIKAFCKSNLTSYMVPSFYIKMEKLPLNPNGKLDRKNLPEPDVTAYKSEYVAPENKIEEAICKAMEEVLKCGQIGRNDDFFMLGGDSVKAMETINILDDLPLDTETFFEGKTPKEIASLIENGGKGEIAFERVVKDAYPLTASQLGVYFAMAADPNTLMYNNPLKIDLDADIDIEKLIAAVEKSVNNHKAYHCSIDVVGGLPCMIPNDIMFHVTRCETDDMEESLKEFVKPFDLKSGELVRATVFENADTKVLAFDAHHINFDGTTLSILLKEIEKCYDGRDIFEEKTSALDLSTYEELQRTTERYEEAKEYFDNLLGGIEVANDFPCDFEDKNEAKLNVCELDLKLEREKLLKFIKENGITENSLFLAAFSYVLAKYNGTDNSCVYVGENGRHTSMTFNTAGMLVKTLALPANLKGENNIVNFIRHLQETFRNSVRNDIYPFSELAGAYGLNNDFSFVYQSDSFTALNLNERKYPVTGLFNPDAMNKMTLMVFYTDGSYRLSFRYRADLYSEGVINAFADAYACAVKEFMSKELLKEVNLLSEEQEKLLDSFCDCEYDLGEKMITDYFSEYVNSTPERDVVVCEGRHYTYGEAGKIADKIAQYIMSLGLKNNDSVGVLIPRNEWIVLASYGVLKAGCAYEPLDPSYPSERLTFMVENAAAQLLITTKELAGLIKDYRGNILFIEDIQNLPEATEIKVKHEWDDNVVLLYTSGTTGTPKGVQLTNKNAVAIALADIRLLGMTTDTVDACYASYGFDACFKDLVSIIACGGTIHVITEEMRLNIIELDQYFIDNKITHTVMTTQVGRQFALLTKSPYLKTMMVGGEALVPFDGNELTFDFYDGYGPSECSVYVSSYKVAEKTLRVPIGIINGNTKGYIVDENMMRLPIGAPGELVAAGCQVGKGYLNLPEKTAEVFIDNPFSKDPAYKKAYRTGDIIRFLPNGMLDFIGRHDGQVKVRGFRVELTEIEEIIRRFDGIKDATVAAFDDPAGGKYLCAYVVSDGKVDIDALNSFIATEKPPYMVPAVTMQIDVIPLNQNQKVNKRALPKPERKLENVQLPENTMQQSIYDICSKVLGNNYFGINTDLYSAGLTSIGVIALNVELEKAFNVPFKVSDIKEHNTIKLIEEFILSSETIEEYELLEDYPLTQTQMGIYIECISNPKTVTYNIPVMMKLSSALDMDRLSDAIKTALNAHPYTKAILFADEEGNIRARRDDSGESKVERIKCDKLPANEELVRPFTLIGEPLYRIAIYETPEVNYLFMDFHHIASDGMSESILLADIAKAYAGNEIKKERYTGYEAALSEEAERSSEHYAKAKEYYDSIFKGCETNCLPPKAPETEERKAAKLVRIAKTDVLDVTDYCRKNSFTPNAYFNSAFGYTLSFFGGFEDAVYTTIYNGRNDSRLSDSMTMLVKTLPVLVHTEGSRVVSEMISETQSQLIESMSNDIYSFAEISAAYGIHSDIIFAYQGSEFIFDTFCGEKFEYVKVGPETAKAPISISVFVKDGKYEITAEYRSDMYSETFMNSFIDVFDLVLDGFTKKENAEEISVLSEDAGNRIATMNQTEKEFDNVPVSRLIERRTKEHPDKTAVISADIRLTYKELNDRANKICGELLRLGIRKDEIVGLLINRTVDVPVCELAIMKAGGAFLPMIPEYPDDRIDYCLSDAGSRFVLTTADIASEKASLFTSDKTYKAVILEEIDMSKSATDPELTASPDSLAYCIYTSGSTGTPKGVMIEHHSMTNLIQTSELYSGMYEYFSEEASALTTASFCFDLSIMESYFALAGGHTLTITTEYEMHNPAAFIKMMLDNNVQVLMCTPSFITNMIDIPEFANVIKNLKAVMLGAEAFPQGVFEKLKSVSSDIKVYNGYGPTETTVMSSHVLVTGDKNITIGGPERNLKYFVYNKRGQIMPPYALGELVICGEGVGRGYINLPDKTKEAFFDIDGMPAYHSGDMVRIDKDNEIEFFGRLDNQVKLRGFRVELDEIENQICAFESINQAKVIVRNNGSEDFLAAYFTAADQVDIDKLTEHLKSKLTYYMVPAAIMQLDTMPLNASGKIDKRALPEIKITKKAGGKKTPKKSLEQELCELFGSILGIEEYYADDNFFELGGTSLSASKITMQLMSKGLEVEYQNIFDNPTPEMLAEYIEGLKPAAEKTTVFKNAFDVVSDYPEQLQYNTFEYAEQVKREPLGNVVLTGAVGFLGIHVLRELLERKEGRIICLVRRGTFATPEKRLKSMLVYYFDDTFEEQVNDRVTVLEADITDDVTEVLKDVQFDTIINCAACVKHYAADDILERINVGGVENLIKVAMDRKAKMIQIPTVSIGGAHTEETWKKRIKSYENTLFVIDDMGNKYVISKYHAELKMLEAIKNGMRGKIIRVGNLMGRHADGEFQINFETNAFLNAMRGFATLGKSPISHATDPMNFSPIDMTAKAVVLLAGTNDMFTAFNCDCRFGFDEWQLIEAANRIGVKVTPVQDEEYYADYYRMLGDPKMNSRLQGLMTNDRPDLHGVELDNKFTANVLYRLGFSWPLPDIAYLERALEKLLTLDYFEVDDE